MDSSDSLKLDENLARFLAAFDQGIEGGDAHAPTVSVPLPPELRVPPAAERRVTPLAGASTNEGSLGEVLPDPAAPLNGTTSAPAVPHRVGRFELRRQLGKGGCGIVFLAYDPKLQRELALKIPRPEMLLNADAKRRLLNEAKAAAEFDHPNLVPVFDTGEIGPLCYIATAFCPGQTLAEWLDRQAFPVPVRQAARLVATVAEAVQHAHDRGVLHRDLKPNNVILQEMKVEENDEPPPGSVQLRGDYFVPRVVDFGLAKLLERGAPDETGTRQILGTPKYMAPEQAQARREDIGPTSDVYALGVVLYEMVAGRAPYDGATDVEVLRQSVEGRAIPPRGLRPDVPRDLEAICLKAMARSTADRYRTAIDLADDLRRFLDGRPTVARPLKWPGRAARWLRRNDSVVAIVVLTTIALFFTGVASWNLYQSRQLRSDRDKALNDQNQRLRAEQQREYAGRVREAFLAWRAGDHLAAGGSLEMARRAASYTMEPPDFTHDYLTRLLKSGQLTIVCPAGAVTALAASPDGTRLASAHADGTLAVWDRATGEPLGAVKAHDASVTHVGFALGGTLLVTLGQNKDGKAEALGWTVTKTGSLSPATGPHRLLAKDVTCLAVSPDGAVVYSGDRGRLHKLHLRDAGQNRTVHAAPGGQVTALAVSRDGKQLLAGTSDGRVTRYTPDLGDAGGEESFRAGVTALAAADGGYHVGLGNGSVVVVATGSAGRAAWAGSAAGRVHWVAASPFGQAASDSPGRVRLRAGGWGELATGDTGAVRAGVFGADGKTLFTGGEDGVIRSWRFPADGRERAVTSVGRVTAVGVHGSGDGPSTGEFVVAAGDRLTAFDATPAGLGGRVVPAGRGRRFQSLVVLNDGTRRGVALEGLAAVVSDLTGNASTVRLRAAVPGGRAPTVAALTPDGSRLAVGDDAGRVTVWSVADRAVVGTIDTGRGPVGRVVLSPDGKLVAAPTPKGVGVWNPADPAAAVTIPGDDQTVFRFVADAERIATADRGGVVRVWTTTGREELTLFGHVGRVTGLGVSPNGRTLVSGGAGGEVKFWDLRTGQELLDLRRHSTAVTVIEFAADGKLLVTGGDGQVAVWDARE